MFSGNVHEEDMRRFLLISHCLPFVLVSLDLESVCELRILPMTDGKVGQPMFVLWRQFVVVVG